MEGGTDMNNVESLNNTLCNEEEVESMIKELLDREEFACTLDGCAGNGCGVN